MNITILSLMASSSICCFVLNSWLSIWIMLELNTLAFCSIMKESNETKKKMTEGSMKYFIIQSISSSIFIMSVIMTKNKIIMMMMILTAVTLMIKIAASPFQQWFTKMVESIEWKASTVLMTWQKLAPTYLLMFQMKMIMLPFILMTSFMGSILQMNKNTILQIMALSSVFNLGWMLTSVMINLKTLILFSLIYWSSVIMMMVNIKKSGLKTLNKSSSSSSETGGMINLMLIMNLAGIPPMPGFLAKWSVFNESLKMNLEMLITYLLVVSSLNLYIYMRMMNSEMTKKTKKNQKNSNYMNYLANNLMILTMVMTTAVVSL